MQVYNLNASLEFSHFKFRLPWPESNANTEYTEINFLLKNIILFLSFILLMRLISQFLQSQSHIESDEISHGTMIIIFTVIVLLYELDTFSLQ